jgi:hypothetical protein
MFTKFSEIPNIEKIEEYLQKVMQKDNMRIIFQLLSQKLDQNFLKETCKFVSILIHVDKNSQIFEHFKEEIKGCIKPIQDQILTDVVKIKAHSGRNENEEDDEEELKI